MSYIYCLLRLERNVVTHKMGTLRLGSRPAFVSSNRKKKLGLFLNNKSYSFLKHRPYIFGKLLCLLPYFLYFFPFEWIIRESPLSLSLMRWKSDLEIKFPFYFLVDILLVNVVSVRGDAPLNESKRPANFASLRDSSCNNIQRLTSYIM